MLKELESGFEKRFKVLSFDLDDALYDNQPVIQRAEQISSDYLAEQFEKQNQPFNLSDFFQIRKNLFAANNPKYENVSLVRQIALAEFCKKLENSAQIAERAFSLFFDARSEVVVSDEIQQMIENLSQHFTLVSVTNGNCDVRKLSIGSFFNRNYSVDKGFRAKPHPHMLQQVLADYGVGPSQLLHIGDSLKYDCLAAKAANVEFYHFEPFVDSKHVATEIDELMKYLSWTEAN
ncbi:HAD family hydrolase [Aliikangiella coralliicola]|uniref:HAD-IA family hydrolase n=1 Tax=Aliikangiella coralliicola TaxID=2592383 RepID=A0A545UGG0_9GAMM|nr:HAD-IA family hydrolase [Aliikangiella coralliicola]TQV88525.1 HAD-IA family hydrolase [Aliikangiella coralliicola]